MEIAPSHYFDCLRLVVLFWICSAGAKVTQGHVEEEEGYVDYLEGGSGDGQLISGD